MNPNRRRKRASCLASRARQLLANDAAIRLGAKPFKFTVMIHGTLLGLRQVGPATLATSWEVVEDGSEPRYGPAKVVRACGSGPKGGL